jgi:hypothetical protein
VYAAGLEDGGGQPINRRTLIGKGYDILSLTVQNNTIYTISNYLKVNISAPSSDYSAYLYISLPEAEGVSISFDSNIPVAGDRLIHIKPGDLWEVSMDSDLGTLLLQTSKIKDE